MKKMSLLFAIMITVILTSLMGCSSAPAGTKDNDHDFGEWTLVKAPTCTEKGEEKRNCKNCEYAEAREVAATGHDFVDGVCKNCKKECSKGLLYTLTPDSKGYYVSKIGSCTDTEIVIPSTYNDKPVTGIDIAAFKGCTTLTSIELPDGITSIGDFAFYQCTALTSIEFPDSVTSIGGSAFYQCTALTSVTIPDSVTCIDSEAFKECTALTSITIPDSVTDIGSTVFEKCTALTSITIGNGVTSIGIRVFRDTAYYNNQDNWTDGVLYIGNYLIEAKSASFPADYTIKAGTTCIACAAFRLCMGRLASITIPDSVTSIGNNAFENCYALSSITIPDSVTSIGRGAFEECTGLTSITIPDSVTDMGVNVFCNTAYYSDNENWTDGVFYMGNYLLEAKSALLPADYTVKAGTKYIVSNAFRDCTNLKSITIPDSVTSISDSAFYLCRALTSIELPDGITSIDESAFSDCYSLTSITIPDSVTSIGEDALRSCDDLANIYFNGTTSQWNSILKGTNWDENTGEYTVTCTDGTISK